MTVPEKATAVARKGAASKTKKAKKTTRPKKKSSLDRLGDGLPANLREYGKQVRRQLNALERDIERAIPEARRRSAKLIREATHNLGDLVARGE
jgi:hypothetical protein